MGSGLVLVEPTTIIRDWLRDLSDSQVWAGGWPQGADLPGTVMHPISSTVNGMVTSWSFQFDSFADNQPFASEASSGLATLLLQTPSRTLLGSTPSAEVLYGGAIESSVSMFPTPPDSGDPGTYGSTLLIDLLTIAVRLPIPP
jgi:hypothetical protein